MDKKVYSVGSLFAGVGGICLGFLSSEYEKAEYKLVWANEIDEYACETYRTNFSHTLLKGDINFVLHPENSDNPEYYEKLHEQILENPIDILNGGFPCQAFSIAGTQRGFEDERGNLFRSIIDLVEQLEKKFYKPRVLFLENVKNLKTHDGGRTYNIIKSELEEAGYTITEAIINTMYYSDLPQNRERIYIIGFLNKEDAKKFNLFKELSKYKKSKTAKERIEDIKKIIDFSVNDPKYNYNKEKYPTYYVTEEEYTKLDNGKKNVRINLDEDINELYQFYQLRRGQYVRKNQSNVCPTLTANMGTGGHNVPLILTPEKRIRKLTPVETFRLQGFPVGNGYKLPEKYKGRAYGDSHLYKQAGNAVSVPIIKFIAEYILRILAENDCK